MNTQNIISVENKAEEAYQVINDLMSNHYLELLNLAYPKHDGEQDADAVAEMMKLRQTTNLLSQACNILSKKLTEAIGDNN